MGNADFRGHERRPLIDLRFGWQRLSGQLRTITSADPNSHPLTNVQFDTVLVRHLRVGIRGGHWIGEILVPRSPHPTQDHQARYLALSSIHSQLRASRRPSLRARRHRVLRSDPIVVPQVRSHSCSEPAPPVWPARRCLACRRGLHYYSRATPLSPEGGGPGRRRPGYAAYAPPGRESRKCFVRMFVKEARGIAVAAGHRRAAKLYGSPPGTRRVGCSSNRAVRIQQS